MIQRIPFSTPEPSGPRYEVIEVTPALAEKWLKQNTHNRSLREKVVDAYARDMANGEWQENGESIKFAADGTMLDGQHRNAAIVKSGTTQWMLVAFDLPNSTQETMDDGAKRKLGDVMKLRGERHPILLSAIVRRGVLWEMGFHRVGNTTNHIPTKRECLAFLEAHPELRASADVGTLCNCYIKIPGSVLGLAHWLFNKIDIEDCESFFARLRDGANLPVDHPILVLRKRVHEEGKSISRFPDEMWMAFLIKTWNAYRDGADLKILRFKPGGANPEKFPLPH